MRKNSYEPCRPSSTSSRLIRSHWTTQPDMSSGYPNVVPPSDGASGNDTCGTFRRKYVFLLWSFSEWTPQPNESWGSSRIRTGQVHGIAGGWSWGQIQSGKTSNYTGLICRAVDAGYRLVIVLAGMHNSLRSQTQLRLDEGFLGFDTQLRQMASASDGFAAAALGVGRLIGEERITAASLTTSEEQGDFGIRKARGGGIRPGDYPVLLVVKKNSAILKNLRKWLLNFSGRGDPPLVRDFPVLVIDDEADNASINTKASEDDPTKVNEAIRRLLSCFDRRAYVGYTATPYANIYIDPTAEHEELGPDLFPASFIEYLRPPTNYFGPSRLFGSEIIDAARPLFRRIRDEEAWIPNHHKNGHVPGPASGQCTDSDLRVRSCPGRSDRARRTPCTQLDADPRYAIHIGSGQGTLPG